jgi:hypothetical protein
MENGHDRGVIKMSKPYVRTMRIAGIPEALEGMRLPTKSHHLSTNRIDSVTNELTVCANDTRLAKGLSSKGFVHGKFSRGIQVWLDINMPRYMWSEIDTYTVGVTPISSESTMYTLFKESKLSREELTDCFALGTSQAVIGFFYSHCIDVREGLENHEITREQAVWQLKSALPEGWMQRRFRVYSYQALANIYADRKNHRLPEWQLFIQEIEELSLFKEIILPLTKYKNHEVQDEY